MKVSFILYALIGSPVVGQKSTKTYSPVAGGVSSKSAKGTKSNKASKTTPPLFTPYHAKFVGTGRCLDGSGRSYSKVVAQLPNGSNHEQCWGWCQQGVGPNTGHLGFEITKGAMCACLFDYGKLPNPLPEYKYPAEDFTISDEGDGFISGLGSDLDTECWKLNVNNQGEFTFSPTSPMPTKAPVSHSPVTLKPTSHSPVTLNPSSHSPSTMHPTSHTDSPTTLAPSSHQPTSAAPVTNPPSSHSPSSLHPSSHAPTTLNPTSHAPVKITSEPSTHLPTTHSPSSHSPSTMRPTSHSPSSLQPTSHVPTTLNPTSHAPVVSTLAPTSHSPSSLQPTSHSPSSVSPTSPAPTAGVTDPKCSGVSCGAGKTCTGGVCHGTGPVRFTLTWTGNSDYDVNINHNNDWLYLKPKAGGGTFDVDSGVQMCYKDPHVENVFWTDQNQAKGQYIVQVTCANGYCNEEWTLNIYLDGNLYKTYKGKHEDGGRIDEIIPSGDSIILIFSHPLATFSY